MRKALTASVFCVLMSVVLSAQPAWKRFKSAAMDYRVSFSCSYTVHSKTLSNGNAEGEVQNGKFRLKSGDIEVICDGNTRWTVDSSAKEVIVESVEGCGDVNPALLFGEIESYFRAVSTSSEMIRGETMEKTDFVPISKTAGIASMSICFRERGVNPPLIVSASLRTEDAIVTDITFTKMAFTDNVQDDGHWRFDTDGTDSSWIITDLR